MNQKDVWKKYITAQSKILEHKSKPIGIDTSKGVQLDGLKLHLSIHPHSTKEIFCINYQKMMVFAKYYFESGKLQSSSPYSLILLFKVFTEPYPRAL